MTAPLAALKHPVVILARGLGTRLASVASGRHKTVEQVGPATLLGAILRDLRPLIAPNLYLHLREPDAAAVAIAREHTQEVAVSVGPPTGYLPDVVDCARYGPRFTVIEADTVTHPGSLRNFLILADQLGERFDLCMGIAPADANPNGPAVTVDADGLVTGVRWNAAPTGIVPLGAWHWTHHMLTDAPAFAAQSTSIADYITWAVPRGARVTGIGFPAGHNVNTPADLDHARNTVAAWTRTTERSITA